MDRATWSNTWRFVAGLAGCTVLGWFAFVRGDAVPVLSLVDLGVHELGHLLTYPFPDLLTAAAGSAFQVLVPAGLAVGCLARPGRPDRRGPLSRMGRFVGPAGGGVRGRRPLPAAPADRG